MPTASLPSRSVNMYCSIRSCAPWCTLTEVPGTLNSEQVLPFFPRSNQRMKVVPLNDKIVVKRLEAEEKTAGGIVLPDSAKEKPKQGKVLSLGDGKLLDNGERAPFQVKEGDRVLFTSYAGNEVSLDGEEYLVMTEDDILAVID